MPMENAEKQEKRGPGKGIYIPLTMKKQQRNTRFRFPRAGLGGRSTTGGWNRVMAVLLTDSFPLDEVTTRRGTISRRSPDDRSEQLVAGGDGE
jgi:hypothetical protein